MVRLSLIVPHISSHWSLSIPSDVFRGYRKGPVVEDRFTNITLGCYYFTGVARCHIEFKFYKCKSYYGLEGMRLVSELWYLLTFFTKKNYFEHFKRWLLSTNKQTLVWNLKLPLDFDQSCFPSSSVFYKFEKKCTKKTSDSGLMKTFLVTL